MTDGSGATSSVSAIGASWSRIASTTIACSSRSFSDREQLGRERLVLGRVGAAPDRARDRHRPERPALRSGEALRGGAEERAAVATEGVDRALRVRSRRGGAARWGRRARWASGGRPGGPGRPCRCGRGRRRRRTGRRGGPRPRGPGARRRRRAARRPAARPSRWGSARAPGRADRAPPIAGRRPDVAVTAERGQGRAGRRCRDEELRAARARPARTRTRPRRRPGGDP